MYSQPENQQTIADILKSLPDHIVLNRVEKAKLANHLMDLSNNELDNELYFVDINPLTITQSNNSLTHRFNIVHYLQNIGKLGEWLKHLCKKYKIVQQWVQENFNSNCSAQITKEVSSIAKTKSIKKESQKVNEKPFPEDIPLDTKNNEELDLHNAIIDDLSTGLSIGDLHNAINRTSGPNSVDNIVNTNITKTQQIQQAIAFYIQRHLLGRFLNSVRHHSVNPVALSQETLKQLNIKITISTKNIKIQANIPIQKDNKVETTIDFKASKNEYETVLRLKFIKEERFICLQTITIFIKNNKKCIANHAPSGEYKFSLKLWQRWNQEDNIHECRKILSNNANIKNLSIELKRIVDLYRIKQKEFVHIQIEIEDWHFVGIPFDQIILPNNKYPLGIQYEMSFLPSAIKERNITKFKWCDLSTQDLENLIENSDIDVTLFTLHHCECDYKNILPYLELLEKTQTCFISHRGKFFCKEFSKKLQCGDSILKDIRSYKALKDDKKVQDAFVCLYDGPLKEFPSFIS